MAQAKTKKLYNTFVKGLITEASPLTYPENASISESNCVIYRKGNRSRRLGVDFEDGFVINNVGTTLTDKAITNYKWETPANENYVNFLCVQVGLILHFYVLDNSTISTSKKPYTINLAPYVITSAGSAENTPVQMSSGKGLLFVVSPKLDPILIEYKPDTDSLDVSRIYIQIRDFDGVDDGLSPQEEPTSLSNLHHYNLRNQGWISPNTSSGSIGSVSYFDEWGGLGTFSAPISKPIQDFYTKLNRYPGNNKQWWLGKSSVDNGTIKIGDFDPTVLDKFWLGNTQAPKGHYILDAFRKDRSSASGVPNIPVETILERPHSVCFAFGRAFYVCRDTVYFTQILDNKRKAGFCYQEADPTSEEISDLIDTDGGVVPIPEMKRGVKILALNNGVLVFSQNGVWSIQGTSNGFTASDISVSVISKIGVESPESVVEADGRIFWWSKVGIQAFSQAPTGSTLERSNISETTVQTFFNEDIPFSTKFFVRGIFDPSTNNISWLFSSSSTGHNNYYDQLLNFDLTLEAFYPWSFSGSNVYIAGAFLAPNLSLSISSENVEDNGVQVSDLGDSIIANLFIENYRPTFIKFVCACNNSNITFGQISNGEFVDWERFNGVGFTYNSYLESGYELLGDAMRKKQAPYVFTYLRRTETLFTLDNSGDYTVDKASSCKMQIKWDWSNSQVSNKWSPKYEIYRHTRLPMFTEEDLTFDTGYPIVVTRHKIRGSGRAIQFRFETDERGKDFDLLGWAVSFTGNTEP
jgi:hypothetical protein